VVVKGKGEGDEMNQPCLDTVSLQRKISGKGEVKRTQGGDKNQRVVLQLKRNRGGGMTRQAGLQHGKSNINPH